MLGKLLLAGAALYGYSQYKKKEAGAGGDAAGGDGTKWGGGLYDVVSVYANGAKEGDEVPLVVLLHGQASTPDKALEQFQLTRPAHVVVPVGRFQHQGGRSYVDPALAGAERDKAQRDEVANLMKVIAELVEDAAPVPPRAIVVGLDAAGPLAAQLGLADPLHVRYAWGTGGALPPAWVPLGLPQLQNLQRPQVRKLSYGNAVAGDQQAAKLATDRGMDLQVTVVDGPPADWDAWVTPDLETFIETP